MELRANDDKIYKLPEKPKWRLSNPPEIGWWPASICKASGVLRYWDGKVWSKSVSVDATEKTAAHFASQMTFHEVQWTDRWWLNQPEGYPKEVTNGD
jgi:hypothetical protein